MVNRIASLSTTPRPLAIGPVVKEPSQAFKSPRFGQKVPPAQAKKEFFLIRWVKAFWNAVANFFKSLFKAENKPTLQAESPDTPNPETTPQKISHPLFHPDPQNDYSTYPGTMVWDESLTSSDAVTCQNEIRTTKPQFCQHKMVNELREHAYTPKGTLILGYDQAGQLALYVHRLTKNQVGTDPFYSYNSGNIQLASVSPNKHLTPTQHQILKAILGTKNEAFMANQACPLTAATSESSNQLAVKPEIFSERLTEWSQKTFLTTPPSFYDSKKLTLSSQEEKAELYRRLCQLDQKNELEKGQPGEILAIVYPNQRPFDISAHKPRWELSEGMKMLMHYSTR